MAAGLHNHSQSLVVASGATTGYVEVGPWDVLGLLVPTIDSGTLEIQVSNDGTNFFDVQDGTGTQVLSWSAGTGSFAVSSRDMADVIGYRYVGVVCGAAQTAARTFTLVYKAPTRR